MSRRTPGAYLTGVAQSPSWRTPESHPVGLQAAAALAALEEAGLGLADVEALFTAGDWARHPSMLLAEYLGIQPTHLDTSNVGGSSFEVHAAHAAAGIALGLFDVALITYGSTQRSDGARKRPRAAEYGTQFEQFTGMPVPLGAYAMAAARHMHEYGTTSEQLAEVAVAARQWAQLNPEAAKRDPLSIDDVLASDLVADPLHVRDCCLITDGAGALVVVSDRYRDAGRHRPVQIIGHGETHTHNTVIGNPDLLTTGAAQSGRRAFEMAGVTHADLDVVQIYDSFTITVLLTLEALGFCGPGESGAFVEDGRTRPGGSFPMNTSGGGLSCCHPGMYGIFLLVEAVRQLRGECGERQVDGAELALVNGTGGVLSSTSTVILARA